MAKIIDKMSKRVAYEDDIKNSYGIVTDYFDLHDINYDLYNCLSDLIKTMTGDAATQFETIEGMIKFIPGVEKCHEECSFLHVWENDKWFILGWDYEEDESLWDKILQQYFSGLEVIED